MAPRRKPEDLKLKSIWDETLVSEVITNKRHRLKMWQHLVNYPHCSIEELPLEAWNVKRSAIEALRSEFVKFTAKISEQHESTRGDTTKLLLELQDGHKVETVVMRHPGHTTVCVSSQIGCQMGCRFCATGTMGIIGNLTSGEILEQLAYANAITRIRNVVFMGMGEPLNNYENVKLAVEFMIDGERFSLSAKHVTVSTVGVLKSMRRMADEMPYVNLALSLHAPNQEVRLKIVPAARAHHIDKLMDAVDLHIERNKSAKIIRSNEYHDAKSKSGVKKVVNSRSFIRSLKRKERRILAKNNAKINTIDEENEINEASTEFKTNIENNTEPKKSIFDSGITFNEQISMMSENNENDEISSEFSGDRSSEVSLVKINRFSSVMIEYILIRDINDSEEHARELGQLLSSRREYILLNLIPYNPTEVAEDYLPPTLENIEKFHQICTSEEFRIHTRVRHEKGQDIAGACGQLALVKPEAAVQILENKKNTVNTVEMEDIGKKSSNTGNKQVSRKLKGNKWFFNGLNRNQTLIALNLSLPLVFTVWQSFTMK